MQTRYAPMWIDCFAMLKSLLRHDSWGIGLIRAPISSLLDDSVRSDVEWLSLDTPHSFFADPFLINEGGRTYCFFEELSYKTNRGKISYVSLDDLPANRLRPREAIATPHHLSYPYLFRHEGSVLCVPESFESGRVAVWSARHFPDDWYERATLLPNFAGVDPTVFRYQDCWWLFCTNGHNASNAELHAWYADDIFSTWRPHAGNPIKRDVANARPGGTPFEWNGRLFRPAQDCSERYGGRLIINEIVELSPEHFRERSVSVLEPDRAGPFPAGLHTASGAGELTVIDGNRIRFEPRQAARAVRAYARKILNSVPSLAGTTAITR